jgi:transposase
MANLSQISDLSFRRNRRFSEEFKRRKVEELDKCLTSIADISREYQVHRSAVYHWIYKYSLMRKKSVKTIVESESDTLRIKALQDHINQLEQLLGQKQFQIDFLNKQIEIASDKFGIDLKKKVSGNLSPGSGKTDNDTDIQ